MKEEKTDLTNKKLTILKQQATKIVTVSLEIVSLLAIAIAVAGIFTGLSLVVALGMVAFVFFYIVSVVFVKIGEDFVSYFVDFIIRVVIFISSVKVKESKLFKLYRYKLLNLSEILFSPKTQENVFKTLVADWDEEYYLALSKKQIYKARWINVRYTYAFLAAMWMKSPLGDLIEFIQKIAS